MKTAFFYFFQEDLESSASSKGMNFDFRKLIDWFRFFDRQIK